MVGLLQGGDNPPPKVSLVGDTSTDPRAQQVVATMGAEINRFQLAARQRAGDMDQFSAQGTLQRGVQAYYTRNNGLETVQLYVPLSSFSSEEEPETPEIPKGMGVLAIDVLFPCVPTTYTYDINRVDGGPGDRSGQNGQIEYRHMTRAIVGATITAPDGTKTDLVSAPTWGQTGQSTKKLSTVNLSAYKVTKVVNASERVIEAPDPPFHTYVINAGQDSMESLWMPRLPLTIEQIYVDYYGATFLVYADAPSEKVNIDLWVAATDNMHIRATFGEGNYYMPLYCLNVQCREFASSDQLVAVNVPLSDQGFSMSFDQGNDWRNDPNYTAGPGGPYPVSWKFIAKDGWEDVPANAPCDRNAKNMGDLLWASQDEGYTSVIDSTIMASGAGEIMGDDPPTTAYTVPGWKVPWYPQIALVDDPETTTNWGMPAAAMYNFATVNWTSRASPGAKGSATVTFHDDSPEPPTKDVIQAGLCGGAVLGALN